MATEADTTGSGSFNDIEHYILDVSPETPFAGQPGTALADPLLIINPNGVITARLFNGPGAGGTDTVVDQEAISTPGQAGTDGWSLTDNLNTPRYIVNDNSAVVDHIMAEAFGGVADESNPYVAHWAGFEGGHIDAFTSLVNDYHRWYDPHMGKWLAVDPLTFAGGDADLERYVGNNPTRLVDRTGLFPPSGGTQIQVEIIVGKPPLDVNNPSYIKWMKWSAQIAAQANQNLPPPYPLAVKFYTNQSYNQYQVALQQYVQDAKFSVAQLQKWQAQVQASATAFKKALAATQAKVQAAKTEQALQYAKRMQWNLACQQQLMLETQAALKKAIQQAKINAQLNQQFHE